MIHIYEPMSWGGLMTLGLSQPIFKRTHEEGAGVRLLAAHGDDPS